MARRGVRRWSAKTWLGCTAGLVLACVGGIAIGEAAITPMAEPPERHYWHHPTEAGDGPSPAFVPQASYTPPPDPEPMLAAASYATDGIDDPLLAGQPVRTRSVPRRRHRTPAAAVADEAGVTRYTAGTLSDEPIPPPEPSTTDSED